MTDEIRYERRDLMLIATGGEIFVQRALGLEAEPLDLDEFRWLIVTAGPAALHELQREGVAGGGGGPPPAVEDATETPDEPECEPDLFTGAVDDRLDPHSVGCPTCKVGPGGACLTPGGLVVKPHAARRKLVAGA